MISFKEYIEEMTLNADGKLTINYKNNPSEIKLAFGKKNFAPYTKKISGTDLEIRSVYYAKGQDSTAILLAIKSKNIEESEYIQFLNRTAVFGARIVSSLKTDIIVMPKSSSDLTRDFGRKLKERLPHILVFEDSFQKSINIQNIKIDYDHPKITEKITKELERILRAAQRDNLFQMKKILPQNRIFIKNIFSDVSGYKKFEGKNVLILDDVISSGSSIADIFKTLNSYGTSEISALTIFKTK